MNSIILLGRLTRDPEIRYTQNGTPVANFCLAVDRRFKNENGEKETDFINCVAWKKTAELVSQYLSKGRQCCIQGALQTRKYTDKEGNNKTAFEIQVDQVQFVSDGGGSGGAKTAQEVEKNTQSDRGENYNDEPPFAGGELPF